jgi:hypothetical protein
MTEKKETVLPLDFEFTVALDDALNTGNWEPLYRTPSYKKMLAALTAQYGDESIARQHLKELFAKTPKMSSDVRQIAEFYAQKEKAEHKKQFWKSF